MMKEKKAHGVQLLLRVIVRDPDGKIITDTGKKPARSFVIQFLEFIYFMFEHTFTLLSATATDGTEDPIWNGNLAKCQDHFRLDAPLSDDTYGIVVGTGDTAETNEDYALETQLTEGAGAGNITHGEQVIDTTAVVGANVDLEIKRAFTNVTGSTITVKEAGVYSKYAYAANYHCIIRDVLAAGVNVPDKCSLTIIYTVRTTV